MRQDTVPVMNFQQVRAQMPPDHAGVGYDDGDASARTGCSCWAVFYDGERIESRGNGWLLPFYCDSSIILPISTYIVCLSIKHNWMFKLDIIQKKSKMETTTRTYFYSTFVEIA